MQISIATVGSAWKVIAVVVATAAAAVATVAAAVVMMLVIVFVIVMPTQHTQISLQLFLISFSRNAIKIVEKNSVKYCCWQLRNG